MRIVHHERVKSLLPKVPLPSFTLVYAKRVGSMCISKKVSKGILAVRNYDQMNMVGHQAIRPDFDVCFLLGFYHEIDIHPVITLAKKSGLLARATLSDVMRKSRYYEPGHQRLHGHDHKHKPRDAGEGNKLDGPRPGAPDPGEALSSAPHRKH